MDAISNYKFINDKINSLAKKVTLIVVSKTFTMNIIKPLINFGHLHFGENRVQEAEEKITALKTAKDGTDFMIMKTASETLSAEISKIGEHMAKAAQTPPAGQTPPGADGKGPEGDVKDAEFKETK